MNINNYKLLVFVRTNITMRILIILTTTIWILILSVNKTFNLDQKLRTNITMCNYHNEQPTTTVTSAAMFFGHGVTAHRFVRVAPIPSTCDNVPSTCKRSGAKPWNKTTARCRRFQSCATFRRTRDKMGAELPNDYVHTNILTMFALQHSQHFLTTYTTDGRLPQCDARGRSTCH